MSEESDLQKNNIIHKMISTSNSGSRIYNRATTCFKTKSPTIYLANRIAQLEVIKQNCYDAMKFERMSIIVKTCR